jgi:hypothetical protein
MLSYRAMLRTTTDDLGAPNCNGQVSIMSKGASAFLFDYRYKKLLEVAVTF